MRYITSLSVLCLLCASAFAFVEDIYLPITEPPLPTTTPRPTRPPPPPPPPVDECSAYCKNISSCKQILTSYLKYSGNCSSAFNWDCFSSRYRHCSAQINCPPDHIRSGFGHTFPQHNRCMPLYMCRYFAQIYTHVNELHEDISWS